MTLMSVKDRKVSIEASLIKNYTVFSVATGTSAFVLVKNAGEGEAMILFFQRKGVRIQSV